MNENKEESDEYEEEEKEQENNSDGSIYVFTGYMQTIAVNAPQKYKKYKNISLSFFEKYNIDLNEYNNGIINDYVIYIRTMNMIY